MSQMPPQIFQPLYKRQETREDFQRDMEFAFEDMYTGERSKACFIENCPKKVCVTVFLGHSLI